MSEQELIQEILSLVEYHNHTRKIFSSCIPNITRNQETVESLLHKGAVRRHIYKMGGIVVDWNVPVLRSLRRAKIEH